MAGSIVVLAVVLGLGRSVVVQQWIARELSSVLSSPGRRVEIDRLEGWLPLRWHVGTLRIDGEAGPNIKIDDLEVELAPRYLLRGILGFSQVTARSVRVVSGRVASLVDDGTTREPSRALPPLVIERLNIAVLRVFGIPVDRSGEIEAASSRDPSPRAPKEAEDAGWSAPIAVNGTLRIDRSWRSIHFTIRAIVDCGRGVPLYGRAGICSRLELEASVSGRFVSPLVRAHLVWEGGGTPWGSFDELILEIKPEEGKNRGPYPLVVRLRAKGLDVPDVANSLLGNDITAVATIDGASIGQHTVVRDVSVSSNHAKLFVASVAVKSDDVAVRDARLEFNETAGISDVVGVPDGGVVVLSGSVDYKLGAHATSGSIRLSAPRGLEGTPSVIALTRRGLVASVHATADRKDGLRLQDIDLTAGGVHVTGELQRRFEDGDVDATLHANVDDLAFLSDILGVPLAGHGTLDLRAGGRPSKGRVEIRANFPSLGSVRGGSEKCRALPGMTEATPCPSARLDLVVAVGPRDGEKAPGVDAEVPQRFTIERLRLAVGTSRVEGNGEVDLSSGEVTGKLTAEFPDLMTLAPLWNAQVSGRLDFQVDATKSRRGQRLVVAFRGNDVVAAPSRVRFASIEGHADIRDIYGVAEGSISSSATGIEVAGVALADLEGAATGRNGTWRFSTNASANDRRDFSVNATGSVAIAAEKWLARVEQAAGIFRGEPLSLARAATGRYERGRVTADVPEFQVGDGRIAVTFSGTDKERELTAQFSSIPGTLLGGWNSGVDIVGKLTGEVSTSAIEGVSRGRLRLHGEGLVAAAVAADRGSRLDCDARVDWQQGRLTAEGRLQDSGDPQSGLDFEIAMDKASSGVASASLRGKLAGRVDLAVLSAVPFFGGSGVEGVAVVAIDIDGTPSRPLVYGKASVTDGRYDGAALGIALRDVRVDAIADGSRITVARIEALDAQGRLLRGTGEIVLAGDSQQMRYRLTLEADKPIHLVGLDEIHAMGSGRVTLEGTGWNMRVEGRLETERVELALPEAPIGDIVELEVVDPTNGSTNEAPVSTRSERGTIELDVRVATPARLFVRGSGLESEWKGSLHVAGTTAAPVVTGEFTLIRATFDLIGASFKGVRGSVMFDGGPTVDPILEVVGEARKHDILARLTVRGRASQPRIELSSEPPLPSDEVLSRLLFGKSPGRLSAIESVQLGAAVMRLSRRRSGPDPFAWIRRALVLDRLGLKTGTAAGSGTGVSLGKYVADRIYVSVNQGLDPSSGKATVDVELSPRLRLQSEVGKDAQGSIGLNWRWDY